jgi:hypothetical protein
MKKGTSKFNRVMADPFKNSSVIDMIENGATLTEINELYFYYEDSSNFCRELRIERPELMQRYKQIKSAGLHTKFHKTLRENEKEIISMIDESYSLKEINNRFFFIDSRTSFTNEFRKKTPELMKRFKEVKRKRNHGV